MGIANIGIPGLILIVILALIVFGPKKLPEIGKASGQTLREFKQSAGDLVTDDEDRASARYQEENKKDS